MATSKYTNLAVGTLDATIDSDDTSLTLTSGQGTKFPSAGDFDLKIDDEFLKATARSTDVFTVVRGQEGTTPAEHDAGADVELVVTSATLNRIRGDIHQTGAFSAASAEKNGNLYFVSDGPYILRDTGSVFAAFGPLMKCVPPAVLADYTWLNQGSATAADVGGAISLKVPNESGTHLRGLYKSVPGSSDFVVEGAYSLFAGFDGSKYTRSGIFVSDGTKLISLGAAGNGVSGFDKWNDVSTFSTNTAPFVRNQIHVNNLWVWRISYVFSSTTLTFSVSADGGRTFITLGTDNSFLGTITRAGFLLDNEDNGLDALMTIFHFSIT